MAVSFAPETYELTAGANATQLVTGSGDTPANSQGGLIVNLDLVESAIIGGYGVNANDLTIAATIPPLGSVEYDGTEDIYGMSFPGESLKVQVMPGIKNWTPSPAQVAAQISALGLALEATQQNVKSNTAGTVTGLTTVNGTLGNPSQDVSVLGLNTGIPAGIFTNGVPLYSKSNQFASRTALTIAPGAVKVIGPGAIDQIGYEVGFDVQCPASAIHPFLNVQLTWTDSVSGLITSQERWTLAVGSTNGITYWGAGPTKGDILEVDITNPDSVVTMTVNCVITANSRVYQRDNWTQQNTDTVSGFVNPLLDNPANLLAVTTPTLSAGNNASRLLPLFAGRVFLAASSNGTTGYVSIQAEDPTSFLSTFPFVFQGNLANGVGVGVNEEIILPRCPCLLTLSNTAGTGSSQFSAVLTIAEY